MKHNITKTNHIAIKFRMSFSMLWHMKLSNNSVLCTNLHDDTVTDAIVRKTSSYLLFSGQVMQTDKMKILSFQDL